MYIFVYIYIYCIYIYMGEYLLVESDLCLKPRNPAVIARIDPTKIAHLGANGSSM